MNVSTRLVGAVRRHPLSAFLLWFFTVGQAFVIVPLLVDAGVPTQWFVNASTLVGLLLPAVVITGVVDGREGVGRLARRVLQAAGPAVVYGLGLLAMPLLTVALAMALLGRPQVSGATLLSAVGSSIVVGTVVGLLANNLWEEVAWMGFVQARLQQRHGAMRAALLVAPLFALQHTALFIQNEPVVVVAILVVFTALIVPFRALMAWVYNCTGGSLLLVGLVHALGNAMGPGAGFGPGYLRRLYPGDAELVGVLHVVAIAVIGLAVMAVTRLRLGYGNARQPAADEEAPTSAPPALGSPLPTPPS